jgi:hypothetical protein
MIGYLPISFIERKVRELESALFFSLSDAVLKFPTCVIKLLEADELGQLWFLIPKPTQYIHAFDKTFPVKLDFFRKGRDYYLKIIGKASLVNDPEEINSIECLTDNIKQMARHSETVLIKVRISHADYVEKAPDKMTAKAVLNQVKNNLYRWLQLTQSDGIPDNNKVPARVSYSSLSSFSN